jgi:hypothetical protein
MKQLRNFSEAILSFHQWLQRYHSMCSDITVCVRISQYVFRYHSMCSDITVCVQISQCVFRYHSMCSDITVCVQISQCVFRYHSMCSDISVCVQIHSTNFTTIKFCISFTERELTTNRNVVKFLLNWMGKCLDWKWKRVWEILVITVIYFYEYKYSNISMKIISYWDMNKWIQI